ncbi:unnamed protein product, partial [Timema podura]|nr:unnamed protein product [Timema podura]
MSDTTRSLDDYGQGDRGMVSVSAALKEAQRLLASIKSHNLESRRSAANKTLRKVEHQLKHLQSLVDNLSMVGPDKQRLADLINRINDLNNILRNVTTNINK